MGYQSCLPKCNKPSITMLTQVTILATLVLTASSLAVEKTKAASSLINCGCQCSSITFLDSAGVVQGNCNTVDGTGAQWCYVDSTASTCQDLVPSQRFPHNPWSHEACATPAIGSLLCPAIPAIPVPDHVHTPVLVLEHEHEVEHDHVPLYAPATPTHLHPDEREQDADSKSAGIVAPQ